MKEIFCTSDPGELAFLKSVFESVGIPIFLFDEHTSHILGGFGAGFTPCRIMVSDSDFEAANLLLDDLEEELGWGDE